MVDKECHISQSAISQQIQALERELGFQLLERKNRKFTLTPAGEHFYKKSLTLFEENLEEARLMIISGKGFMPVEGVGMVQSFGTSICRIPLCRGDEQIKRNYCAFWKKDNSGYYVEEFADMLKAQYEQ